MRPVKVVSLSYHQIFGKRESKIFAVLTFDDFSCLLVKLAAALRVKLAAVLQKFERENLRFALNGEASFSLSHQVQWLKVNKIKILIKNINYIFNKLNLEVSETLNSHFFSHLKQTFIYLFFLMNINTASLLCFVEFLLIKTPTGFSIGAALSMLASRGQHISTCSALGVSETCFQATETVKCSTDSATALPERLWVWMCEPSHQRCWLWLFISLLNLSKISSFRRNERSSLRERRFKGMFVLFEIFFKSKSLFLTFLFTSDEDQIASQWHGVWKE